MLSQRSKVKIGVDGGSLKYTKLYRSAYYPTLSSIEVVTGLSRVRKLQ